MRHRIASAGLILALAAILIHWRGFGYDELRRPFVIFGAALALAAGAGFARSGSWLLRMSDLALLALVVSAFFAVNPADAGAALFPPVVAWIFLRATALGWISRPFLERRGLLALSILGIAFAGYGLCQRLGGDFLGFGRGTNLAVSTIGNTNYSGVLSAALALAGLATAVFERGLPKRITGGAAALLCGLHIAASGSLGGLAGLGAGVAAFAVFLVRRHGWKPVAVIPFLILAAAIVPVASRLSERIADVARGEDRTSRIRLGLWKGTLRLVAAHPVFGCGVGSFRAEFPPFRDAEERRLSHEGAGLAYMEAEDPHNSYLAVLSESGPVALIAILAALALALRSGFRRARDPDSGAAGLAFAGSAGLIVLAVSGFFNSLSGHLPYALLAGVFAGFAVPCDAPERGPSWSRAAATVAALLLAIAPIPWLMSDVHFRAAMYTTNQAPERIHYAQRAVDALPGNWQAHLEIAMSWRALGEGEGTALAELREVLRLHPHSVWALVELAAGSPPAEEEDLLRRAEALAPENAMIQNRLVGVDLRRRDYAGARRRLEQALKVMPDEPETVYSIARTWLWERKHDEALPWLKRAIAKNPKYRERLGDDHPELKSDARFSGMMGP